MTRKLVLTSCVALVLAAMANAQESRVLRGRFLEARPQALRATRTPGDSMPLRLFSDSSYEAVLEDLDESRHNGLVWRGHLADLPHSWVVMVEHRGVMAGVISTGEQLFRVSFAGAGLHRIEEIDPRSVRQRGDDAVVPDLAADFSLPVNQSQSTTESVETTSTEIDVLIVYTNKAAKRLTKDKYWWVEETNKKLALESQAMLSIAVANAALENSRIPAHFRLVGIEKVKGKGSKDFSLDLSRLADPTDGYFDKAHTLRSQLGADFVVMAVGRPEPGVGGTGYLNPSSDPVASNWAFSVVYSPNLWWTTVVHEIGHNMGLVHNPENDSAAAIWRSHPYSRGYRDEANALATLMSYVKGCDDCWLSIPHFSNPKVKWQGRSRPSHPTLLQPKCRGDENPSQPDILFPVCGTPTGSAGFNSAKSIKKDREIFAAFRACRVDCQSNP